METINKKKYNIAALENKKEQKYWLEKLEGDLKPSNFFSDKKVEIGEKIELNTYSHSFDNVIYGKLHKINKGNDTNLFMILAASVSLLLDKYTDNKDLVILFPIEKQANEGKFINKLLTLRNKVDDNESFKEFLLKVRQSIIGAVENQNYPIETLSMDLNFDNLNDFFQFFDVAVLLESIHERTYLDDIPLNIIFTFNQNDEGIQLNLDYNKNRYTIDFVKKIACAFELLLFNVLNDVNTTVSEINILSEYEIKNIEEYNKTKVVLPKFQSVIQKIEQCAKLEPDEIAIRSESNEISYKDLMIKVSNVAGLLKEKGVGAGEIVAIMGVRNIEMVIAILGILKAGGAYLPINAKDPYDRIMYVLNDSKAHLVLTQKKIADNSNELFSELFQNKLVLIDELHGIKDYSDIKYEYNLNDLAYVIYTSGTTGKPKGVMIENHNLINYLDWASDTYVQERKLDLPFYTSFSFDMSITSMFLPLITGNTILLYGGGEKEFLLEKVILDNKSGIIKATPSHLRMIRDNKGLIDKVKESGNKLNIKKFIVGGEALETNLAQDIYNQFEGEIEIFNEYGPTEATVGCMIYKYKEEDKSLTVPVGKPIQNTQIYILDRNHNHSPIGVPGELYIAGGGLARGYLFKPELSGSKFITNPFGNDSKLYKTGDLAVRLPDGNIEFLGRIDNQVKVRGYRVELGEIERKILEFQKTHSEKYNKAEEIKETWNLENVVRCKKCLIPQNYPGININEEGVCSVCEEFDKYKGSADEFFKESSDFDKVIEKARKTKKSKYDCLLLYSGGKDSSYVLHRLVERGLKVLAFTYDNGYVSEKAFENIKRTTELLEVDLLVVESEYMNEVFVESLRSEHNVCNGCFKGVNTVGTKIASEHNINLVISGLSRGQIFDIKLQGLFRLGIFDEKEINERLQLFRKEYHSMKNKTSRLLNIEIEDKEIDEVYFEDYFEYDEISVHNIFEYLKEKDGSWARPNDTGLSSSNCMINDVGIYVHLKDTGYHFYSAQLSWDVRLGTLTREEGIEEITEFKVHPDTHKILTDIGYYKEPTGAVVIDKEDNMGEKYLCAYIVENKDYSIAELRSYLSEKLPDYMIPAKFVEIDVIPLSSSGKINRNLLPEPELKTEIEYVAPRNEIETKLVEIWSELLDIKTESIGIDLNFFELGGHSLKATMLLIRITKDLKITIPLVKLFEKPTIREISEMISALSVDDSVEYEEVSM